MKTKRKGILFISSYPPKECGIATYCHDLVCSIKNKFGRAFSIKVCALDNEEEKITYTEDVKYVLPSSKLNSYIEIAGKINKDNEVDCICIQHEFGLFGGPFGEYLLYLLCSLEKPVIVTFHTVLPDPCVKRRAIVKSLVILSESIIVLTKTSAEILKEHYDADAKKIHVIPHGTHPLAERSKSELKRKYNLGSKLVLSTFGLLSSNKSIETVLGALPGIKNKYPDVVYIVLGKTHPGIVAREGEKYRFFLRHTVKELGLPDNVLFVNKYLSLDEILDYLALTDIYLFSSKDPHQAVSGTFAYAQACGCPVIATPIPHAKEMIDEGTGLLFNFGNSAELEESVIKLLGNEKLREDMGRNAIHRVRASAWENVAISHIHLLSPFLKPEFDLIFEMPRVSLQHIERMTTPSGIVQFCDLAKPSFDSGYTLDDNARALIALAHYFKITRDFSLIDKLDVYLNFIKFCQQKDGKFLNYIGFDGRPSVLNTNVNLEDSNGRAIWALGYFIQSCRQLHPYFINRAAIIFLKALDTLCKLSSPRAISFAIKGLYRYNLVHNDLKVKSVIRMLSKKLMDNYIENFDQKWEWFEQYLTYANSVIPEAMLCAFLSSREEMYKIVARDSFDFLIGKIFKGDKIRVISNNSWHQRGKETNEFGEQPIDIAYTILALHAFYQEFKEVKYRRLMDTAFSWFLGNNHLHQTIYNSATGGCFDGLEEHSVNLNQGAESTICYLMARLAMEEAKNRPVVKAYGRYKEQYN